MSPLMIYNSAATSGNNLAGVSQSLQAQNTGGSREHENRQPFLAMNYIICMEGAYPSRS